MKKKSVQAVKRKSSNGMEQVSELAISKTYKLYIGGAFPRTESGRYLQAHGAGGVVNYCRASRKDFRNAVVAAAKAQKNWASRSAYNRGQILYRIAEMMDGRMGQLQEELMASGLRKKEALHEVRSARDMVVHYAGWCDKFQQVFSAVNPVATSYFNFTTYEPVGIVAITAPERPSLLGMVAGLMPVICGGNTAILVASETEPLTSITFAEILHTSDLPGGVVNILTGKHEELIPYLVSHMEVNALLITDDISDDKRSLIADEAPHNLKRVIFRSDSVESIEQGSPYLILDTQEAKTTWHPIGR